MSWVAVGWVRVNLGDVMVGSYLVELCLGELSWAEYNAELLFISQCRAVPITGLLSQGLRFWFCFDNALHHRLIPS